MKKHQQTLRGLCIVAGIALFTSLLAACGGGEKPGGDAVTGDTLTGSYTFQQQVFSMCMLSNISAHYNGKTDSAGSIQDSTINAVTNVLGDAGVQSLIGTWKVVWGPCVETNSDGRTARNTMFIAQKAGTDSIVVAIAGTDPSSAYDWFAEDFDVVPVFWNKDIFDGMISAATSDGLGRLKKMTSNGQTAQQALAGIVNNMKGGQIYVTGHSLGGALSPAYALHLADSMQYWTSYSPGIHCLAVAGASPGDRLFADYYNKKLGATTTRVWNMRDVIPHGYAEYMLAELPTLYPADSVAPMPQAMDSLVAVIEKAVKLINYTQLTPAVNDSFMSLIYTTDSIKNRSALMPADTSYMGQMLFQHIPAYGVRFGTFTFQQAVQRVLNLPDPFFTQSAILVPVVDNGNTIQPF